MLATFVVVLVCVCSRVRAWQRVRARPPAHRLPSDRLAIHQRTCSPALPDKKAAPLIPRLSPLPLLGSCRHLTARGKLTRCAQAICQQKEILARSLSWCVLAPALSVCVLSPGRIRPRRAWQQFRESSKQGPDLPIWMVRVFSCCLDCNAALQGANIFVKLCELAFSCGFGALRADGFCSRGFHFPMQGARSR